MPWCLGGDFNVVRFPRNRLGARRFSVQLHSFNGFVDSHALVNLPLKGASYTWLRSQEGGL